MFLLVFRRKMSDGSMDDDGRLFPDLGSSTHDNREIRVRFLNRCAYPVDVFWLNPSVNLILTQRKR